MSAHKCHVPGCPTEVPPHMLMCLKHWRRVPELLRKRVWRTYRKGQEIDKNPSPAYLEAATAAIKSVQPPKEQPSLL